MLLLCALLHRAAPAAAAAAAANAVAGFEQRGGAGNGTCAHTIDNPGKPRTGMVRAGDDFQCLVMPESASVESCAAACCSAAGSRCKSFSWNAPWALPAGYMGCEMGQNCCCLKSSAPPLEANKWTMNITTGLVTPPPPPLCITEGVCCSLNGVVVGDRCQCDPGWRGDDCGELDLPPAPNTDGAYQHKVNLDDCKSSPTGCGPSSWGGLPLKGPDGKWHLFASQFVNNCTLAGWNPGSSVIRAVSEHPEGPFTYAETVFPTFHHNPTVRKLTAEQSGDGSPTYVMLMIGDDVPSGPGPGKSCVVDGQLDVHHLEGYIKMAWSKR